MRIAAALLTLLALAASATAAPASAGVWMQVLCQNPDGSAAPLDGMTFSLGNGAATGPGSEDATHCVGGLNKNPYFLYYGAFVVIGGPASVPTWATATYTAPAGSVIAGGSIDGVYIGQTAAGGSSLNNVDAWISTPADAPDLADAVLNCEGGATIGLSNERAIHFSQVAQ